MFFSRRSERVTEKGNNLSCTDICPQDIGSLETRYYYNNWEQAGRSRLDHKISLNFPL